jgi:hypothetical protein
MALSRKRQREFDHLKNQTEALLRDQREVIEQATRVVQNASHQAAHFAREEVAPRVHETYEDRIRPAVRSGYRSARSAVRDGRERFSDDVVPAVTSALGSAMAIIEAAKNPAVRDALVRASKGARSVGERAGVVEAPKSAGPARYIFIGVALVAAAGVAYAAWQTLRADDSLWIEDEPEPETDEV